MPGKTKRKEDDEKCSKRNTEKTSDGEPDTVKEGNWSEDQREKSYYYDDAHGYEIYNPDEDEE